MDINSLELDVGGRFVRCLDKQGKTIGTFPVKFLQKIEEELWIRDTDGHQERKKSLR